MPEQQDGSGSSGPGQRPRGRPFPKGVSGNPAGKRKARADAAPPAQASRADGWGSVMSGIGVAGRDKRMSGAVAVDLVGPEEARELWRGDDIAARIIETLPNEMLREGFELSAAGDEDSKELQEVISSRWEDLGFPEKLREALCIRRALGGAAILLGANDGATDLSQPLNVETVRTFDWMTVLEATDLRPAAYYANPLAPKFGEVAVYDVTASVSGTPYTAAGAAPVAVEGAHRVPVHESRLLIFQGTRVSRGQQPTVPGWGDSVLTRCRSVVRDFGMSWGAAAILLQDFAQPVYKMQGLAEVIAQNNNASLQTQMAVIEMMRSSARLFLIDGEDEFERQATPMGGLPEMLDRLAIRLAAAADMPVTLLMGQSPAGLNATGESDIRTFYDRVKAAQARELRPVVERVVKLIFKALGKKEPESWTIQFRPLWQPTEKEQAEARLVQAQVDKVYIEAGVLSPEEVAINRFGGDVFNFATQVDFEARAALEPAAPPPQLVAGAETDADNPADGTPPARGTKELPDVEEAELVDRADRQSREG